MLSSERHILTKWETDISESNAFLKVAWAPSEYSDWLEESRRHLEAETLLAGEHRARMIYDPWAKAGLHPRGKNGKDHFKITF